MAITVQLSDGNPFISAGLTTKQGVSVISRENLDDLIPRAFDLCLYESAYIERCFAESGGVINDDYKNDKTDLLFGLSLPTDTVSLKLFKLESGLSVEKATITDNTYGVYYASSAFPDQKKIGFVADWNLILDAFGVGVYYWTADRVIINVSLNTKTSHLFRLSVFDEFEADGTIRVVTKQFGTIEGGIDYDLEWTGYIRLYGFFGTPEYEYITENYISSGRSIEQIQDKIRTVYTMNLKLHPDSILIQFIKDRLLSNEMEITTYGVFDFLQSIIYKPLKVYPESIEENNYFERNSNGQFVITFTDKVQTPIKRRYT